MADVNAEFIERYQIEYQKNPQSRIFAPLAEAYRKMGLIEEANRICIRGVQLHPDFAGGRVAYAKVLLDLKSPEKALAQLEKAVQSAPDNILAHSIMGETLLQLRRPKEALKAFKMVLFLNPNEERAKQAVAKWEFLQAEEYDDELFDSMNPDFDLRSHREEPAEPAPKIPRPVERAISLADAFTVRGELDRALSVLEDARIHIGAAPEIEKRIRLLARRTQAAKESEAPVVRSWDPLDERKQKLETLLRRINERRLGD